MMKQQVSRLPMKRISIKQQSIAVITAVAAAVAMPQIFHIIGIVSGQGTAVGETFLPMQLPILLVGLLAGPYIGAAAGLLAPLVSFALSGMPGAGMLPFMMLELFIYGLCAGLLREVQLPVIFKVMLAQLSGRGARAIAILLAVYVFGSEAVSVSVIWNSIVTGIPGILLQWSLLPLIVFWKEHRDVCRK